MRTIIVGGVLGAALAASGCEPASVIDARDQLGRGPETVTELTLPVARDTFTIADVNITGDTAVGGLSAVRLDPQALPVPIGGLILGPVDFEVADQVPPGGVDFGDLNDAILASTLNTAIVHLEAQNSSQAPVVFSNTTVGVVELDAMGNVPRDGSGNPLYETDAGGTPILVAVADPGQSTLTVPPSGNTVVELQAGALADRVVHMVLDGRDAALVSEGTASIGPGGQPTDVQPTDVVTFGVLPVVVLDFTIPDSGVVFTENTTQSGLDLDSAVIDELTDRLDSAISRTVVDNATPFGVAVRVAYAAGDQGTADIFSLPGAVVLAPDTVRAPSVGTDGRIAAPVSDTLRLAMAGGQVGPLLGPLFTAGVEVRLLPGAGGNGRAAVDANARVIVRAGVTAKVRAGGAP